LRTAGLVGTRRNGRETVCSLRADAFETFVTRERAILGLTGDAAAADNTTDAVVPTAPARRVAAS
jgi:hypothetical protein